MLLRVMSVSGWSRPSTRSWSGSSSRVQPQRPAHVACLAGPVRDVVAGGERVGVVAAQHPLLIRQQLQCSAQPRGVARLAGPVRDVLRGERVGWSRPSTRSVRQHSRKAAAPVRRPLAGPARDVAAGGERVGVVAAQHPLWSGSSAGGQPQRLTRVARLAGPARDVVAGVERVGVVAAQHRAPGPAAAPRDSRSASARRPTRRSSTRCWPRNDSRMCRIVLVESISEPGEPRPPTFEILPRDCAIRGRAGTRGAVPCRRAPTGGRPRGGRRSGGGGRRGCVCPSGPGSRWPGPWPGAPLRHRSCSPPRRPMGRAGTRPGWGGRGRRARSASPASRRTTRPRRRARTARTSSTSSGPPSALLAWTSSGSGRTGPGPATASGPSTGRNSVFQASAAPAWSSSFA